MALFSQHIRVPGNQLQGRAPVPGREVMANRPRQGGLCPGRTLVQLPQPVRRRCSQARLQVWVDANSNGVSDAGELRSLADAGVLSIDLKHDNAQTTQNGNVLQGFSSFTTTDGQSHQIVDAWLMTQVQQPEPTQQRSELLLSDVLQVQGSDSVAAASVEPLSSGTTGQLGAQLMLESQLMAMTQVS